MAIHVPPPHAHVPPVHHAPPEVLPGPTFGTALFELRRWIDEAGRLHDHELAFLRSECNRLSDLSRWQDGEIKRLAEQVKAQESIIKDWQKKGGGSSDNDKSRGTKRTVPPPSAPPGQHASPNVSQKKSPAPPKNPPPVAKNPAQAAKNPPAAAKNPPAAAAKAPVVVIPPLKKAAVEAPPPSKSQRKKAAKKKKKKGAVNVAPAKDVNVEEVVGRYLGYFATTVVKGFGYISCEALQADVFVHKDATGSFKVRIGAPVDFEAFWHKGYLQARDLKVPTLADEDVIGDFVGKVKTWRAEDGFGFISHPNLYNEKNETDVYINIKQVEDFELVPGAKVLFEAYWRKGRLQGRYLRIPPEGSNEGDDPLNRVLGTFIGEVLNFNDKGFGFIGCEDLDENSCVHPKNLGEFVGQVGAAVEFQAYLFQGRLQGRNLVVPSGGEDEVLGDYLGTVLAYHTDKKFGFIRCEELENETGKPDLCIHAKNVGDFDMKEQVGAPVLFEAFWHRGRLQCRNLREPPLESTGGEEILGYHVGSVKSFNPEKGYGFISCQELTNELGNHEAFFHKNQFGDQEIESGMRVEFEAYWDNNGRLKAKDLHPMPDEDAEEDEAEEADEVESGSAGKALQAKAQQGSTPEKPRGEYLGEYFGVVKAFFDEKGFGFIACDALRKMTQHSRQKDVYVHRRYLDAEQPIKVGMEVQFEAYIYNDQASATKLRDVTGMDMVGPQMSVGNGNVEDEFSLGEHTGIIRVFHQDKGFGFIKSEELKDYEGDIWVHYSSITFPMERVDAGVEVNFEAYLARGRLQARNVEAVEGSPAKKRKQN